MGALDGGWRGDFQWAGKEPSHKMVVEWLVDIYNNISEMDAMAII